MNFCSDQIYGMNFRSDQICGMNFQNEKNEKDRLIFRFFHFFHSANLVRTKVHSANLVRTKVHFFFIPQRFRIFGQTSSLIAFILKIQFYDNVKHEPAFFQFLIPALSPTLTTLEPSKSKYVSKSFAQGSTNSNQSRNENEFIMKAKKRADFRMNFQNEKMQNK